MNTQSADDEPDTNPRTPPVDPLDDVFGSAPSSPVLSGSEESRVETDQARPKLTDPSDVPRLRSIHVTSGYREGIAASKEKHIQEGFDEGYSLGAELGMKAGWCLGALRGLYYALPTQDHTATADVLKLLREAEEELNVQALFGKQYFGPDGIWVYDVVGQENDDEASVTFARVAAAHPVISKWMGTVQRHSQVLGLVLQ